MSGTLKEVTRVWMAALVVLLLAIAAGADPAVVYVDDDYNSGTSGWGATHFATIQEGIDAVDPGGTVNVYPGTYNQDEANDRDPDTGGAGTYDFNIFVGKGMLIQGVTAGGTPVTDYDAVEAFVIAKRDLPTFGEDALFIQADDVTVTGLDVTGWDYENNKTIECVGDNFTLKYCKVDGMDGAACLYFDDRHFDPSGSGTSHIQYYRVEGNLLDGGGIWGNGIRISSGPGWGWPTADRVITGNTFQNCCDGIEFVGPGGDAWDHYPVGAATITNNNFTAADRRHVVAWGKYLGVLGYVNPDWQAIRDNNTFDKGAIIWTPGGECRYWDHAPGTPPEFFYVRGIYGGIQRYAIAKAVAGDRVELLAGTYEEQVEIDKALTLDGAGQGVTVIRSPVTLTKSFTTSAVNKPVVYVHGADGVIVRDLTVDGYGRGNTNYRFYGIAYYNAGGTVEDCEVKDVRETPLNGNQHGNAIYAYTDVATTRTVDVTDCTVYGYQKNGITLNGAYTIANVNGCDVDGCGPTGVIAQNGIQIGLGATGAVGTVSPNTSSGNSYTGSSWGAAGILVVSNGAALTQIADNTVSNNLDGIFCQNGSATITGNTVTATQAGVGVTDYIGIMCDPGSTAPVHTPQPVDGDLGAWTKPGYQPLANYDYVVNGNVLDGDDGINSVGLYGYCYAGNTVTLSASNNIIGDFNYGVIVAEAAAGLITSVDLHYNSIASNDSAGFYNAATVTADAEMNWWGSASGPGGEGPGTGDAVYGPMDYDPWIGKLGGENIVCVPDPKYLTKAVPTGDASVEYLGGGNGLVYGYSVKFSWDGSKVTLNGVTQGSLLSSQGSTQFFTNVVGDTCRVDCVLLGASPGVTGPGTMFTVNFTGIASGVSPVDISVIKVRDKANAALSGFYEDDGELVVDIVDPVVSGVFIENVTLPHTDDYIKDGQTAKVTATVTDDVGIATIRANLICFGGGGSVAPDSVVGNVAYWTVAAVVCNPANGTLTVTVTATDTIGNVGTGSDTIIADNTAPAAIANLAAAQQKSGNDGDGTTKIALTYTAPGDAWSVEVYRAGFGSYPEYDDAGGVVPTTPGYAPPSPWALTGVVSSGQKDEPAVRDYWYYVAFVKDIAWNVSAVSNQTGGTLNYHLGDVTDGTTPGTGDNLVNTADLSTLSGTYWKSHGAGGYLNYCDVGPTTDYSTNTRPTTDNVVDFEDLMMFAINFTTVSLLASGPVPFETPQMSLVVEDAIGGVVRAHLMLTGNRQSVKGLHGAVAYDPASLELVGVSRGGLVGSQSGQVFFAEASDGGRSQVDLAVMGSGLTLRGSGEVAVLEFRVLSGEASAPVLAAADLRDRNNKALRLESNPGQQGDHLSASVKVATFGAYPNPFRGETQLVLELPSTCEVTLKVYDVSGRQVAELVDGVLEAGSHRLAWDGRGSSGSKAAPGVYLAVARVSGKEMTGKLFLLP